MTTGGAAARPLRILHRSYAGDGAKPRPPYFSKLLALVSLIRAADALPTGAELVFLNDGPMPEDRLRVMEAHGEVRAVRRGGSDSRSYREMLSDEAARPGGDDELIWLAEDDYLYTADALHQLVRGADGLPHADYFMLYGSASLDVVQSTGRHPVELPLGGADHPDAHVEEVGGTVWFRIASTTSTFGLRRGALRADLRLLRFGALTGGAWDNISCNIVQGFRPVGPGALRADLLPFATLPVTRWPTSIARGLVRSLAVPLSRRPAAARRVMMGTDPERAFHMEATEVHPHPLTTRSAAIDWAAVAAECAAWGRERGIPVPQPAVH